MASICPLLKSKMISCERDNKTCKKISINKGYKVESDCLKNSTFKMFNNISENLIFKISFI